MNELEARVAVDAVVPGEVDVGELDLPVGEQLSVHRAAVDPVRVEPHHVRSAWQPDQGFAAGLDQAPGSGHGYQVAPGVQGVAVSRKVIMIQTDN